MFFRDQKTESLKKDISLLCDLVSELMTENNSLKNQIGMLQNDLVLSSSDNVVFNALAVNWNASRLDSMKESIIPEYRDLVFISTSKRV